MNKLITGLLSLAAVSIVDAHAEGFIGVAGGASQWPGGTCSQAASSCDHRDGTWSVRAGYMFLPYAGIEARYVDLGSSRFTLTELVSGTETESKFRSKGAGIGAVFAAPVWENLALTAVVGAARMKTTFDTPDVTIPAIEGEVTMVGFHAEEKKTHAYYGVGVDYRFAPNLSVGAEATRYRIGLGGTDDVDAFTASLTYHFR